MEEAIFIIIIIFIVSLGVFGLIKIICKPISTKTAILLVVPTVVTCGIALILYKALRGNYGFSGQGINKTNSNYSNDIYFDNFNEEDKGDNKKIGRSYTDEFGKTTYYDEVGNIIGTSLDNGFDKSNFTDSEGNYVGESYNNNLGHTTYTDKDGNITSSETNSLGDEQISSGTTKKSDSFGNDYYS